MHKENKLSLPFIQTWRQIQKHKLKKRISNFVHWSLANQKMQIEVIGQCQLNTVQR